MLSVPQEAFFQPVPRCRGLDHLHSRDGGWCLFYCKAAPAGRSPLSHGLVTRARFAISLTPRMSEVCCEAVTQEVSYMQLHAAFPELSIAVVNDFLAASNGDAGQAMHNIESLLGPSKVKAHGSPSADRLPGQPIDKSKAPASHPGGLAVPTGDACEEAPVPTPAATPPAALLPTESRSPPLAMPHLFPVPSTAKQPAPGPRHPKKNAVLRGGRPEKAKRSPIAAARGPLPRPVRLDDPRQQPASSVPCQQEPVDSQPAAAPATPPSQAPFVFGAVPPRPAQPSRRVGLPVPLPLPAKSLSGSNYDGNMKSPKHARSGMASGVLELLNLSEVRAALKQPPSTAQAAAVAPAGQPAAGELLVAVAPIVTDAADMEDTSPYAGSQELVPSEHAAKLDYLQGMFVHMDVGVVADVFHACGYNHTAAMDKLLAVQDVNDRSGLTDSSSDNGSYSAGANTFGGEQWEIEAPLPAHNHMVGQPWDVSGTATDYSLKECTLEEKLDIICRELPGCSAEEATRCLEVCDGDVDVALAHLSQAHDGDNMLAAHDSESALAAQRHAEAMEALQLQFPSANAATLTDFYAAASGSLDEARQLLIDNGVEPKAPDAPLPAPVSLFKLPSEANVRQASQLPPQGLLKGPVRRSTVEKQRIYDDNMKPVKDHLAETKRHFHLAAKAYDRFDSQDVEYHKQQGLWHRAEMYKERKLALNRIHKQMNNKPQFYTLELHGLHVEEAVRAVSDTIRRFTGLPGHMTITVITGKGLHSVDGPRVRPAVIHYLRARRHQYSEFDGHVCVYLKPPEDGEAGDEVPGLEDPGPSDRGRRGSSSEGSPERWTNGPSGGGPNGAVLGDFLHG